MYELDGMIIGYGCVNRLSCVVVMWCVLLGLLLL